MPKEAKNAYAKSLIYQGKPLFEKWCFCVFWQKVSVFVNLYICQNKELLVFFEKTDPNILCFCFAYATEANEEY